MPVINYAIADDHKIFRQGLRLVLQDDPELHCIGEAANGLELLELLAVQEPAIVLLDLKMPDMDGIEATKQIRLRFPEVKIIMLTMHNDESLILHMMELGVNGYLIKNADAAEIIKAMHVVAETNYYFNELVSTTLLKEAVKLTERELQVLRLICAEQTATEIGAVMFLSPRTVEGIRATLLEKTGAKNTAGLVLYAVRNGHLDQNL